MEVTTSPLLGFDGLEPVLDGSQPIQDRVLGALQPLEQAGDVAGHGHAELVGGALGDLVLEPLQVGHLLEVLLHELQERRAATEVVDAAGRRPTASPPAPAAGRRPTASSPSAPGPRGRIAPATGSRRRPPRRPGRSPRRGLVCPWDRQTSRVLPRGWPPAQATISTAIAIPSPPPTHNVATPRLPPVRFRPLSSVTRIRAPLQPTGWPSATAPP